MCCKVASAMVHLSLLGTQHTPGLMPLGKLKRLRACCESCGSAGQAIILSLPAAEDHFMSSRHKHPSAICIPRGICRDEHLLYSIGPPARYNAGCCEPEACR